MNPPHRVGRKRSGLRWIELLDRLRQPRETNSGSTCYTGLEQILQQRTIAFVTSGNLEHDSGNKSQIANYRSIARRKAASLRLRYQLERSLVRKRFR
jgi:hypothetical protein